jgi:biotin carboxyl carrier protein
MRKYKVGYRGREIEAMIQERDDSSITVQLNGELHRVWIAPQFSELRERGAAAGFGAADEVRAPISGILSKISCAVGDSVKVGDTLAVLEAMKMENKLCSPGNGVVKEVFKKVGEEVRESDLLISLELAT